MTHVLLVLVLVTLGCAAGPRSYGAPVPHRASYSALGLACGLIASKAGIDAVVTTVGCPGAIVAVSKAIVWSRHPERLGPWSPGDVACDLLWTGVPMTVGRFVWRKQWRAAVASLVVGGAGLVWVQRRCVP
jgi:hypothetical protein